MKKKILSLVLALALVLTLCLGLLPVTSFAAQSSSLTVSLKTAVYSISKETFVRWTDEQMNRPLWMSAVRMNMSQYAS